MRKGCFVMKICEVVLCRFKEDRRDLIIVDTSGRHKQSEALFEEMRAVADAVAPDLVIFVMDSSIGQAAHDQAAAFRSSVQVSPSYRRSQLRLVNLSCSCSFLQSYCH